MSRQNSQRPTMRDVADAAGVSVMTVSRVVNGNPAVSPDAVAAVHQAIAQLGYHPNRAATDLRRAGAPTRTFGVILDDVSNSFMSNLHRGIEETGWMERTMILAGSSERDPARERELVNAFIARRVDGLIIVPSTADHKYLRTEMNRGLRVVYVGSAPSGMAADVVTSDYASAIERAVAYLAKRGHRNIAFLGHNLQIGTARARIDGYISGLAKAQIALNSGLIRHDLISAGAAYQAAREVLSGPDAATAIIAAQNTVTTGAIERLQDTGLQDEIALIGFGEFPLGKYIQPSLTYISQDARQIGSIAARRLMESLADGSRKPRTSVVPTQFIVGNSGDILPRDLRNVDYIPDALEPTRSH